MAYVQLSADTLSVVALFGGPQPGNAAVVQIADADARLAAFITPTTAQIAMQQLGNGDGLMFRALEVLIDVLLAKAVIVPTDFSVTVRNLYTARKALRVTAGVP
jgi:hypothetical protein